MKNLSRLPFLFAVGCLFLMAGTATAQVGPMPPPPPIALEIDSASNTLKSFDYKLEANSFTHKQKSISQLKNHSAMIFYFSAKCPHCQKAIPLVMELAKKLSPDSIPVYGLAVGGNSEKDLAEFVSKYKVNIPVFHDHKRAFGRNYGTGRVPLVLMINKKGNYAQINGFNEDLDPARIAEAFHDKNLF